MVQRDLPPPPSTAVSQHQAGLGQRTVPGGRGNGVEVRRSLLEDETKTGQRTPADAPVCNGCIYTCNYTRLHQFVQVGPRLVWTTEHQKLLPVSSPGWTVVHEVSSLF